jgi:hypothetical protein
MIDDKSGKEEVRQQKQADYLLMNNRFSMKFPAEWEDRSYYRFEGPVEYGIKHSIIVTIENNVEVPDLEQYADLNIKALETELQGYQELKRGSVGLDNRVPAYELVYKWTPVEGRQVYQRVIYILMNKTGYVLTATFSKKTWKMLGSVINKILMSFTAA